VCCCWEFASEKEEEDKEEKRRRERDTHTHKGEQRKRNGFALLDGKCKGCCCSSSDSCRG
jgi:hypothetical protein